MLTKKKVIARLNAVIVPGVMRSLVEMNLVRDIILTDHKVDIKLAAACIDNDSQTEITTQINGLTGALDEVESINVTFESINPKDVNQIDRIIAVMSGKGGVGKSLVSGLTAISLRRQGYSVGILDADITGPSIPKMFGVKGSPACSENGMLPLSTLSGIEIMSLNLLLPAEEEAVIWRGPVIAGVITQFWDQVLWGKLDYLIIDLPPGTADAPLTVLQKIPVSGIIIVSSPQELASMIVKKAVHMAKRMQKPIIGVIENMSYLYVPEIDKKIEIFGKSRGEEMAQSAGAPLLAQLPLDPQLAALCDKGQVENYRSDIIESLGKKLKDLTPLSIPLIKTEK